MNIRIACSGKGFRSVWVRQTCYQLMHLFRAAAITIMTVLTKGELAQRKES